VGGKMRMEEGRRCEEEERTDFIFLIITHLGLGIKIRNHNMHEHEKLT
jgi:hypothetical protein